jgi:hypothetical protein
MRRRTALVAWAMGGLSAGLALAAVVLAGRNGESLSELVFNHHAIGIVSAIGLAVLGALIAGRRPGNPHPLADERGRAVPRRLQLHPAVRAPGRRRVPPRRRPGELACRLDQPAGHRHHHHLRLPAVP